MTRCVILGPRNDGTIGIFVSPAGVDAFTAADSALLLNISSKVSQLILLGRVSASAVITLGLSRSPYVFVTGQYDFSAIIGHTLGPGPARPSPGVGQTNTSATINSNGASMTISTPTQPVVYQVYAQAFT